MIASRGGYCWVKDRFNGFQKVLGSLRDMIEYDRGVLRMLHGLAVMLNGIKLLNELLGLIYRSAEQFLKLLKLIWLKDIWLLQGGAQLSPRCIFRL